MANMSARQEWEAWARGYPPREVFEEPETEHQPETDYITAVCIADKAEESCEVGYEAVLFQGKFYIVRK